MVYDFFSLKFKLSQGQQWELLYQDEWSEKVFTKTVTRENRNDNKNATKIDKKIYGFLTFFMWC